MLPIYFVIQRAIATNPNYGTVIKLRLKKAFKSALLSSRASVEPCMILFLITHSICVYFLAYTFSMITGFQLTVKIYAKQFFRILMLQFPIFSSFVFSNRWYDISVFSFFYKKAIRAISYKILARLVTELLYGPWLQKACYHLSSPYPLALDLLSITTQKMKKYLMENFIFCAVNAPNALLLSLASFYNSSMSRQCCAL